MTGLLSTLSRLCTRIDEELMARVKAHADHQDFARLVRRWDRPIWRLCARMVGDAHRAEDLKQDTFLRLFENRKTYEPSRRFSTYLWRIALNVCYDELRRQERRHQFLLEGQGETAEKLENTPTELPTPDQRAAQSEEGQLVRNALLQLPEIYRTVLVLRHYENLKLARIAEVLDIPEGTVNSRMAEALSRLSKILEPQLRREKNRVAESSPFIQGRSFYEPSET